jgi:hypothetical protein
MNAGGIDRDGHVDLVMGNDFPNGANYGDQSATSDGRTAMQASMGKAQRIAVTRKDRGANRSEVALKPYGVRP